MSSLSSVLTPAMSISRAAPLANGGRGGGDGVPQGIGVLDRKAPALTVVVLPYVLSPERVNRPSPGLGQTAQERRVVGDGRRHEQFRLGRAIVDRVRTGPPQKPLVSFRLPADRRGRGRRRCRGARCGARRRDGPRSRPPSGDLGSGSGADPERRPASAVCW